MFKKQPETTAMETELFEQPQVMRTILNTYITENGDINFDVPKGVNRIILVASGSSFHSAYFAAGLLGQIAHTEARAIYSSEFLLIPEIPHSSDTLYVFITQSGETSDTNQALLRAKEYGLKTLAVTNKKESTIWNAADYKIGCLAGEEKSIAATKSFTSQMLCLALFALKYAAIKGVDIHEFLDQLETLPQMLDATAELRSLIKETAAFLAKSDGIAVTADGISYALAKETALKTRETSYLNTNAMILGEFMHGHMAVLSNKKIPLIYVESGELSYTAIKNLNKIDASYSPDLIIIGNSNSQVKTKFNLNIKCESPLVKAFCIIVIAQLLALEIALKLGRNVDEPQGLHKVVV